VLRVQRFREDLMRGFVAETFSWSMVYEVLCQCDFFVGDLFDFAVFGKELAQQAVAIAIALRR
jgi:hypothetical protein